MSETERPMVTVTTDDGRSVRLPVCFESEVDDIEAALMIFGNVVVRLDRQLGPGPLFGYGVSEKMKEWLPSMEGEAVKVNYRGNE